MHKDELEHYGRLGMKWGQHIFGKERAYNYSVKRLRRLDAKIQKREAKSAKYELKGAKRDEKANRTIGEKRAKRRTAQALKYKRKSARQSYKAIKTVRKTKEWVNAMNEVFSDMRLESISAEDVALGRRYSIKAIEDYLKNN